MKTLPRVAVLVAGLVLLSRVAVLVAGLVLLCGAASRQAFQTFTSGGGAHAFLSAADSYVDVAAGTSLSPSAYVLVVAGKDGIDSPHASLLVDESARIQFRDAGGKLRTISLSKLADVLDATAAHDTETNR